MESLQVIASFDWLEKEEEIGRLYYEDFRGDGVFSFEYSNEWLKKHSDIGIGTDLRPFTGIQYPHERKDIFCSFADSLPDYWGRKLIALKINQKCRDENIPLQNVSEWDYLKETDDFLRLGALRYKDERTGEYVGSSAKNQVPPLLSLEELYEASRHIEDCIISYETPEKRWVERLFKPGSSVGGARPKACVVDGEELYIAKFPSVTDMADNAKWEYFANKIAENCGIRTAKTRICHLSTDKNVFLSKRFDRSTEGKRIHMASAVSLLGIPPSQISKDIHHYSEIADLIISIGCNVEDSLEELYRRIALNICIGNGDDHLKNHAFLLTRKGWELSPVYDINPDFAKGHALLIDNYSNESSLDILFNAHKDYHLSVDVAYGVIKDVINAMTHWEITASECGLKNNEIDVYRERFDFGTKWKYNEPSRG